MVNELQTLPSLLEEPQAVSRRNFTLLAALGLVGGAAASAPSPAFADDLIYSTDEIFVGSDSEACLTDLLNTLQTMSGKVDPAKPLDGTWPINTGKGFEFATSGTTKSRLFTVSGLQDRIYWSMNASYSSSGWTLDNTAAPGWFVEFDAATTEGDKAAYTLYRIPTGTGTHTDQDVVFQVTKEGAFEIGGKTLVTQEALNNYQFEATNVQLEIPTEGWTDDTTGFKALTISNVDWAKSSLQPLADVVIPENTTSANTETILQEWAKIRKITIQDQAVRILATAAPSSAITAVFKLV